jgi:hypothetical protein
MHYVRCSNGAQGGLMKYLLTQKEGEDPSYPLWELLIPKEGLPRGVSFERIENFLKSTLSHDDYGPETPGTNVSRREDGILVTFAAGTLNPQKLKEVFRWLEEPY